MIGHPGVTALPRYCEAGPATLDLFHRDAFIEGRWMGLSPREFALLWRLAETPGKPVSRRTLLADVWRVRHEPATNSVEVHVSRLRTKLAAFGLRSLVATGPQGGYLIDPATRPETRERGARVG